MSGEHAPRSGAAKASGGPLSRRERITRLLLGGDWLPHIIIESILIVFSILVALSVGEWQENRANHQLAQQALLAFRQEIRQNQARLQDVGPYRQGLQQVIEHLGESGEIRTARQFYATVGVDGLRPAFLTSTVWETSLTTGAIPHIPFRVVTALSMTYSLQDRLEELGRTSMPALARGTSVPDADMDAALRDVAMYLGDLHRSEIELATAYDEALRILGEELVRQRAMPPDSLSAAASDASARSSTSP